MAVLAFAAFKHMRAACHSSYSDIQHQEFTRTGTMSHHVFIADPGTKSCMQEMGVMGALDARLPPQLACDFAIKEQGHKAMGSYDILAYLVHGTVSIRIKVNEVTHLLSFLTKTDFSTRILSLKIFLRWLSVLSEAWHPHDKYDYGRGQDQRGCFCQKRTRRQDCQQACYLNICRNMSEDFIW